MNCSRLLLTLIVLVTAPSYTHAQFYCGSDPVAVHGALSVEGTKIVDKDGQVVSFAGNSMFWSNTFFEAERFYNPNVVSWLEQDWNSTIFRAAMGVEDPFGYLDEPEANLSRIRTVVDAAIANGVYVIIDWHSHNAEQYPNEAIAFFEMMARDYGDHPNVIYEIYNEPIHVSWSNDVKPYAERVIRAIRAIDPDNLIIVGSPTWSQDVDVASRDPIRGFDNIAYTLHFYAATHREELRVKARTAIANGIALFVTEWGTVEASADGEVDHESVDEWMTFCEENDLSHCNWSVHDKLEGASILRRGASSDGGWGAGDLTESGLTVREIIRNWPTNCEERRGAYPNGVPHQIPGTINASHFDTGGQGVSYFDTTFGNLANGPRDGDVDSYDGGVGFIDRGEWFEFTVDVQTSGRYSISSSVATITNDSRFRIEFEGQDLTGTLSVPNTGSFSDFTTVTANDVQLDAGQQTMRVYIEEGPFNITDIVLQADEEDDVLDDDVLRPTENFSIEGVGVQRYEVAGDVRNVNVLGRATVIINGVEYTRWSNRFPPRIDGKLFIEYRGVNIRSRLILNFR